jgi:hypothetical protein
MPQKKINDKTEAVKPKKTKEVSEIAATAVPVDTFVETKESKPSTEVTSTLVIEEAAPARVEVTSESARPPDQTIAVSGIPESISSPLQAPELEASEASDSDLQTRRIEFENWVWNNRFATVEEKQEAYKRIVG